MQGISWPAEELLALQECLRCMQSFLFDISSLEDEDRTLRPNVGIRLSSGTASYPRRTETSNINKIDQDC
jgi:hypothetical protein